MDRGTPYSQDVPDGFSISPVAKLQGPTTHHRAISGSLTGHPKETVKYAAVTGTGLSTAENISHTHHYPYMDNNSNMLYPQLVTQNDSRITSYSSNLSSPAPGDLLATHLQGHGSQNHTLRTAFGSHARAAELKASTAAKVRNSNPEVRSNVLFAPEPTSIASLALLTPPKPKQSGALIGTRSDPGNNDASGIMDNLSQSSRAARSAPRMPSAPIPIPTSHPLRNVATYNPEQRFFQGDDANSQYHLGGNQLQPHGRNPFLMDPNIGPYVPINPIQPMTCQPTKPTNMTLLPRPATPEKRPMTADGLYIFGPDDLSPSKQEEKFAVQKRMMEKYGDISLDQVHKPGPSYEVNGSDGNYLHTHVPPGLDRAQAIEARIKELSLENPIQRNRARELHGAKGFFPRDTVPVHSNKITNVSAHGNLGNKTQPVKLGRLPTEKLTARMKDALSTVTTHSKPTSARTREVNDEQIDFNSPAWDVGSLRRAGLIPQASSSAGPSYQADNRTSSHFKPQQDIFPSNQFGAAFGRYIGGHMSEGPDAVYRPVPWAVTPAAEASAVSSPKGAKFPPPGLTHPSAEPETPSDSTYNGVNQTPMADKATRMAETLEWFHTDRRDTPSIFKGILDKQRESSGNPTHPKTPIDPHGPVANREAIAQLIGRALASLTSYVDQGAQGKDYFSDFGPVPNECCEPSKDGFRSFFDIQPGPFNHEAEDKQEGKREAKGEDKGKGEEDGEEDGEEKQVRQN
ncbi:hypothetical protein FQN57_001714 [Myotisia sp. PD_48]|nr:hypothetical protein FQN57_001714 [Myotisia sp. PD_48]